MTPTPAWSLRIEWSLDRPLSLSDMDLFHESVPAPWYAVLSVMPGPRAGAQLSSGRHPTLQDAVNAALEDFGTVFRKLGITAAPVVIDALTEAEHTAQQAEALAQQDIPDLYWPKDIARELGIDPRAVWLLLESQEWKKHTTPVMTLRSGPLYTPSQIEAYKKATGG